jgi:hypothetical protein
MLLDAIFNEGIVGVLAAIGAAFCFGYALGHHSGGRRGSPESRDPGDGDDEEAKPSRWDAVNRYRMSRLRRRPSAGA